MALLDQFKSDIKKAEAGKVNEGFKPLESGVYTATLTKFGLYTNNFNNTSLFAEVAIRDDNGEERLINVDRGLTLKDGTPNKGTLTLAHEVFAACGVDPDDTKTGTDKIKSWGKEFDLESFVDCYNLSVSAFVRETFEEGAKYDKGNIVEAIFNAEGKNSDGEDQVETFKKKITETPILIKTSKKAAGTTGATGTAEKPNASAASRL